MKKWNIMEKTYKKKAEAHDHFIETSNTLVDYYALQLKKYGDTALGAAWPNEEDCKVRFKAIESIIRNKSTTHDVTVFDLGCGTGSFFNYIEQNKLTNIKYFGIDRLEDALRIARKKFPSISFYNSDILHCSEKELSAFKCDFLIANGLFTVKRHIADEHMWQFMTHVLEKVWPHVRQGVIFNVMSKSVDWERDDLFHVSYDRLARYLHGLAGRNIGFCADYGLYEYMAYALKPTSVNRAPHPTLPQQAISDPQHNTEIAVCRPLLPTLPQIAPYITAIDQTRLYSNHGPLSIRLGQRLSALFGLEPDTGLRLSASGTMGLVGAILASAGRARQDRPLALCPAHTFVATANAAEMAGYQPHFVDVDPHSWAFEPTMAQNHSLLERVGLVLVTAPYGQFVAQHGWTAFMQSTGIPVVIDAAASFENVCAHPEDMIGPIPVVLSLHATKTLSCGEGGVILCRNTALFERITGALNFGFCGDRRSRVPSTNGKMSEYHAAVGLAELDNLEEKRATYHRVVEMFLQRASTLQLIDKIVTASRIASCYLLVHADNQNEARKIIDALHVNKIAYRHWYGPGLHHEPIYRHLPHGDLPVTEQLGKRLIGLPISLDLSKMEVHRIINALADGLQ